jgi:hypothetical protein
MRKLRISRTITPERLPFNEWMHHVITRRGEIEQILNPTSRQWRKEELNRLTVKKYL